MPYSICITLFFNNEVHDPVFKFLYFILFSITVFNWFTDLIGAHWDITLFYLRDGVQGANKMRNMLAYICHLLYMWARTWYWYLQQGLKCFLFHRCRPEVLTLVASHVQLQALQGAQRHFWTSNLMETYFINEQICNYAAISKSKVQPTMKSSLNCVAGARNALQAHCMLQVMSLDMFIS